jgi:hypothetical protein
MGPSEDSTPTTTTPHHHHQHHVRPRRVSDGSINGGVRKDMLLQRMAEALQSERAKAIVFQRELQNAEREVCPPSLCVKASPPPILKKKKKKKNPLIACIYPSDR